ncbi:MAG: hypothetical protein R6T96_04720 [Longimicrobiales bacterium]
MRIGMLKRPLIVPLALLLAAFLTPMGAEAQGISLELRGGLNLPVGDFSDEAGVEADSEAGIAADLILPIRETISLYAGFGREWFGCDACEGDDGLNTTGLEAGVKFILPSGELPVLPWIRGGATFHKAEFTLGGVEADSDWGLGYQASVGVDIPLGEVLSFSPALRYQAYTADFDPLGLDFLDIEQDISFLSLDFGFHIHFQR